MLAHSPQYVSQRGIYASSHVLGILHPEGGIQKPLEFFSFQDVIGLVLDWEGTLHTVGRNNRSSMESKYRKGASYCWVNP